MAKDRKKKIEIHHILLIGNSDPILNKIRFRILRGTHNKIGILVNDPSKLKKVNGKREVVIKGKPNDQSLITKLIQAQNFSRVYVHLNGDNAQAVEGIIAAAKDSQIEHLVFVIEANHTKDNSSLGLIKGGQIPYTIIRIPQINRTNLLSYTIVKNAQPVSDSSVSNTSVADLAYQILKDPDLQKDVDLGIAQLPYK